MTGLGFLVLSALYQPAKRKQNEKTFQDLSEPYVHVNNTHNQSSLRIFIILRILSRVFSLNPFKSASEITL